MSNTKLVLVAVAGAVGAATRYRIGASFGGRAFPWATLGINLTGSLILGAVMAVSMQRGWGDATTVPVTVGLIGSYTTFSTFSYETFHLARTDRATTAAIYVAASLLGGVLAAAVGFITARRLA